MKSKQLLFIEKYICLAILYANSVYSFLKCICGIAHVLLQTNSSYFSKMALVRFQCEPVSLDINETCFEEEQDIPNTRKKSRKSQSVIEWCRNGK